jgi:hypothetical protein
MNWHLQRAQRHDYAEGAEPATKTRAWLSDKRFGICARGALLRSSKRLGHINGQVLIGHADYLRLREALDITAQPLIAGIDSGLGYGQR